MNKALDYFGNEIHIGDYVVTTSYFGSHISGFSWVYRVNRIVYNKQMQCYDIISQRNYPPESRGALYSLVANECLVTTQHHYIQSQKIILKQIRNERLKSNVYDSYTSPTIYTSPTSREMSGIYGTADWQRPYIKRVYYDKKTGKWVINHPQTRKRKARKTNRFVMPNPLSHVNLDLDTNLYYKEGN